ncbi:Glutathione S-transferase domain protein [Thalassoporum mexicanum PCC 7367]|uniref:glutathione binding-like protein n=1 Tax=Thalassoporum mexicanum TaxID=3457544 RepID=UPI00029F9B27|nr:glutathione binding-like protein [Pseudanabaena sp. PCC 7367]AFY70069.1 Glutathione S-transferase domain protein [Pseudanabaena sp. PCC 7367]
MAIDLYYWATPNGHKITIFLEEAGLEYNLKPINIMKGDQFKPEFLKIAPNNRIPAIVDHDPIDGGEPISIFESGAILFYLAQKIGKFIPSEIRGNTEVLQWLMWQMGGLGPMMGQANHFVRYAPEPIEYAERRYLKETRRLFGVMEKRLNDRAYLVGEYSIADMACYPWTKADASLEVDTEQEFPHVYQWQQTIGDRAAVIKAYEIGDRVRSNTKLDDQARKNLFGDRQK